MANIKLTQQVLEEMAGAPVVLIDRSVLPHEEILARQYTAVQVELTERQLTERVAAINIQITQDGRIPLIDGDRANAFASRIEAACIVWSYRNVSEVEKNKAGSSKILLSSPEDLPTPNFMTHIHGSVILPDLQMMNAKEHWCSYSRLFGETQPEVESDRSISLLHEIQHLLQPFRASQIIAPVGLYSSELHAEAHALLKARELGIKEEAITARLAARSTAAFIGPCPQEYWLTPGCVAALNDLPQPQYADIVWAMHEIHYRVSLRHSNQMMANDSSTLRA